MVNECTITHSLVNSGTAVILKNISVKYGWKNLNEVKPIPGKYDIVENQYGGFENPKISISGIFDVEDIDSNELTQTLLVNFASLKSTTPITLSIPTGETPIYLKGRPSGGYETDGTNILQNTISVVIDSFDINISTSSETGRVWRYNINLHEAQ